MMNEREIREMQDMRDMIKQLSIQIRVLTILTDNLIGGRFLSYKLKPFSIMKHNGKMLGDLMTIDEFYAMVSKGALIDYDGHGRFATVDQQSDITVTPSIFKELRKYVPETLTHVIWFNR